MKSLILGFVGAVLVAASAHATSIANDAKSQTTHVTTISSGIAASLAGGAIAGGVGGAFSLADAGGTNVALGGGSTPGGADWSLGGRAGGNGDKKLGVWGRFLYADVDYDQIGAQFDGAVSNFSVGADYKINPRFLVGLAASYENTDIDTNFFNAGRGTLENDGWGFSPYLGFQLTPQLNAVLSVGYTFLDYDISSSNGGVRGSFDARRWTVNAGLNGNYSMNRVKLLPTLGILYVNEKQDDFRTSNNTAVPSNTITLGRLSAGGRFGYDFGRFTPYVKLIGEWDFQREDAVAIGNGAFTSDDKLGAQVGLGMNFQLTDRFSGQIEGSYDSLGREDLDVWSGSVRVRMEW